jgi:outer membrane lipoprotein-sorting protein
MSSLPVPARAPSRPAAAPLLAALLGLLASSPNARADEWKELRQDVKAIAALRARFVQTKALAILLRPLVSRGGFAFRAPGSIRWEYETPVRTVTLIHRGKVKRFVRGPDGKLVADTAAGLEAMRAVTEQLSTWLSGEFEKSKLFQARLEKGPPLRVVLVPREAAMARYIRRVVLEFSARRGVLDSLTLVEGPRATTVIKFEKVALNPSLPDKLFEEPE